MLLIIYKGSLYGQGVYFAVNSSYSNKYCQKSEFGYKKMFRACVLVGKTVLGDSSMKEPPVTYDSTCDPTKQIYACYHDNQCYPEYIISYLADD